MQDDTDAPQDSVTVSGTGTQDPTFNVDFETAEGGSQIGDWCTTACSPNGNSGSNGFSIVTGQGDLDGNAGLVNVSGRDWNNSFDLVTYGGCLLYTSPSPRD